MTTDTTPARKPSPTLAALARAAATTRLGARLRGAPRGDALSRMLAVRAPRMEPAASVASIVARHLVGTYQRATHGHPGPNGETSLFCVHDEVEELERVLAPLRAGWRAKALESLSPVSAAGAEAGLLVAELLESAGLTIPEEKRDQVGVVVRGDVVHIAVQTKTAGLVRREVPRSGRLWESEASRKSEGTEAREVASGDRAIAAPMPDPCQAPRSDTGGNS